jgi:hypothetical protein
MVTLEVTDMGVCYTQHGNGSVLEAAGEGSDGEWWCSNATGETFAEGTYERDGDADVMRDADGNELARLVTQEDWASWAERMLARA